MKVIQIKGMRLGEGNTKICIPLVSSQLEQLKQEAKKAAQATPDLVEWRVDFFDQVDEIQAVERTLECIVNILDPIPLLFTFRTKSEGGQREITEDYYQQLNQMAIKKADIIDVELLMGDTTVLELCNYAHRFSKHVIVSNHDFEKTPPKHEILNRLRKMYQLGADIPKIAVMPQTQQDVLTLLYASQQMYQACDCPIITMSMGHLGMLSRIAGNLSGSALTFGAIDEVSAPGQIAVQELKMILNVLSKEK